MMGFCKSVRVIAGFEAINGPYKCECGGYVVSPSGKTQGKWIDESTAYGNDCPTGKCEWWGIP